MISPMRQVLLMAALLPCPAAAEDFDCLMYPFQTVDVGAPATGILEGVSVSRGDIVRKGDVIASLDSTLEQATVDLLRTRTESDDVIRAQQEQLEMTEKRVRRATALRERQVATEDVLETAEAERLAARSLLSQAKVNQEIAEKELKRAEAALSLRQIRSPLDGIVIERAKSPGEYIGADDHVAKIVQLDPLNVEAFLPVALFTTIKPGARAEIRPNAPIEGVYEANVKVVDRVIDAASGTFGVLLELPNPGGTLPGGHRCTLSFPAG